uniref:Uncharacterized protein n=1 Tax=Phytophthora ramorum TaxID=164328 RepID=H3GUI2_PHYRM
MADDPNTVLAFLLGSAPSLDAASESDSSPPTADTGGAPTDDTPQLEPVSDSDAGSKTDATTSATSDWDVVTSCDPEDETVVEPQNEDAPTAAGPKETNEEKQEICNEVPNLPSNRDSSASETEHEDDCASPTSANSELELKQEVKALLTEKKQKRVDAKSSRAVVKAPKARQRSAETRVATVVASKLATSSELPAETEKDGRLGSVPTLEELLFVGCVATVLVAYLVACVYSLFHPLAVPLPDYEELYSAYDISNVSVQIVSPVDNSLITPQGVSFEWKLVNFPVEALHVYGAEVFRYRVSVDDEVIASEVDFLSLNDAEEEEPDERTADVLNRTVHLAIPRRKFVRDDAEPFKLHLEVTIPIPGLIGELKTYEQDVYVRKPADPSPEDGVQLTLTAPADGATFEEGQSFVLEYTAVNVQEMQVFVNENVYFKKTHVTDGNLLVRGLGARPHTLEIKALNEQGEIIASSTVHVEIVERLDAKAA